MTLVTCRQAVENRDQLHNPSLGNRVWAIFTFLLLASDSKLLYFMQCTLFLSYVSMPFFLCTIFWLKRCILNYMGRITLLKFALYCRQSLIWVFASVQHRYCGPVRLWLDLLQLNMLGDQYCDSCFLSVSGPTSQILWKSICKFKSI